MPYKDLERKRQWEREHREQRNARRRTLRLYPHTIASSKAAPDPLANQSQPTGWKEILGLAVGVGILMLAAFAGTSFPDDFGPPAGSDTSTP